MNEKTIINEMRKKNKTGLILIIVGILLILAGAIVAYYIYTDLYWYWYYNRTYGLSGPSYTSFGDFFTGEFFEIDSYYGYMIIAGFIVEFIGIIIKVNAGSCVIAVTNDGIREVNIPNQTLDLPTQETENAAVEVNGEVERLKKLKELLDAGILTQEEFDAKKKQILGL